MKEYKIEITLADNKKVYKTVKAEDEIQAMDKVYEDYVKKKTCVWILNVSGYASFLFCEIYKSQFLLRMRATGVLYTFIAPTGQNS